jgi:hypothetical protein
VDDRQAQFFISVASLCSQAHLARLVVDVVLESGAFLSGVPEPPPEVHGPAELDHTGHSDAFAVDGVLLPMSELVEVRLHRP